LSFSDSAGTLTATPGRLIPLLLEITPPSTTSVTMSVSVTSTGTQVTLPSSMSSRSPGARHRASRL
jgi:hypothetical protein